MLSLVRAFATLRSNALALLRVARLGGHRGDVVEVDPRVPDVEVRHAGELLHRLAVRARHGPVDRVALRRSSKPRSRPATAKLATSRFTSHSNGPGSVSSKSLMLKMSRRSGAAKAPKFERCASPQSWTSQPGARRAGQVGGHEVGGAAVERERRHEHPPVADRDELGHPRRGLLLRAARPDRGRPAAGAHSPCADRGAASRAALPFAARSAALRWWTGLGGRLRGRGRASGGACWTSVMATSHRLRRRERIIPFVRCRRSGGA